MTEPLPKLGLIAGGGSLPAQLIAACRSSGRDCFVIALEGHAEAAMISDVPQCWMRMGAAADIIERLRHEGVAEIVMAGPVRRPSFAELKPDWRTAKLFARITARALGDDGLLRAVAAELESEGFRVIAAHDVLEPLLLPLGVLGRHQPDEQALADIAGGQAVARALGAIDVGQAAVVQQGIVLGVEAIEGTDALLRRCGGLRREGPGGVLVKMCKPQQDRRLDMPTMGLATITGAAEAGLRGIAAEAGGTLLLDRAASIAEADKLGLFVIGIAP